MPWRGRAGQDEAAVQDAAAEVFVVHAPDAATAEVVERRLKHRQ